MPDFAGDPIRLISALISALIGFQSDLISPDGEITQSALISPEISPDHPPPPDARLKADLGAFWRKCKRFSPPARAGIRFVIILLQDYVKIGFPILTNA